MDKFRHKEPVVLNIGYFDPFNVFKDILQKKFNKRININSLHWKLELSDSIRTIENVQLNYVEDHGNSKQTKAGSSSLKEYMKLIFVTCSGVDEYKSKVRPVIRQWLNNIKSINPSPMYCIVLYEDVSLRTAADKFLKTSILTKIRNDFSDSDLTLETAFRIKSSYSDSGTENATWNSLLDTIKSGLAEGVTSRFEYFTTVRPKSLGLRKSADLYAGIGQFDDAMAIYRRISSSVGFIGRGDGFEEASLKDYPMIGTSVGANLISNQPSKYDLKVYLYRKQIQILIGNSISAMGLYMKNLVQLAISLLDVINCIFDSYKKNEFSILLIGDFFANNKLQYILDKGEDVPAELYERLGDLKLAEKDEMVKLGRCKDYQLGGAMIDVSLTPPVKMTDLSYQIQSSVVNELLSSEKQFRSSVLETEEECIKLYSRSPYRGNTVDTLSTEVALILYYGCDDYETSFDVIKNSYTFYKESGWMSIAVSLLKVYMDNLKKLRDSNDPDLIPQLLNCYLEMIYMGQTFESDRLSLLVDSLDDSLTIVNDKIIRLEVDPIVRCESQDVYSLSVTISSKLPTIAADEISLTAIPPVDFDPGDDFDSKITFFAKHVSLGKNNKLKLQSTIFKSGNFTTNELTIHLGKLVLITHVKTPVIVHQIDSILVDGKVHPNLMLDILVPSKRCLNEDKLIMVATVGDNSIDGFRFKFAKTHPDRIVTDAKYEMFVKHNAEEKRLKFEFTDSQKYLCFTYDGSETFERGTKLLLYLPYFFPPDVSDTKLQLTCSIEFGGKYSKTITKSLTTMLEIAVSVQDLFKSSELFSKYTINSVMLDTPVRIQNVSLLAPANTSHTKVQTWLSPKDIVAFIEQGTTFFFRLENLKDKALELIVDYDDIHAEIVEIIRDKYIEVLRNEHPELLKYSSFISQNILDKLNFKQNLYALSGRIRLVNYSISDFTTSLREIDPVDLAPLVRSLDKVLSNCDNQVCKASDTVLKRIKQQLLIHVPLPVVNLVHIIEMNFEKRLQYLVCEPIQVVLTLDTFILQHPASTGNKKVRFTKEPPELLSIKIRLSLSEYEHSWLIAGTKSFTREINLNGEQNSTKKVLKMKLSLIPLRVGRLELPKIEVQSLSNSNIAMEVNYKNSSETVFVVSELNKMVHTF